MFLFLSLRHLVQTLANKWPNRADAALPEHVQTRLLQVSATWEKNNVTAEYIQNVNNPPGKERERERLAKLEGPKDEDSSLYTCVL